MESFWQSAKIEDNYTLTFAFYLDQTYSSAPFSSDIPDCSFASPSQLYGFLDLVPATKYFLCFLNQGAVKCLSFSLTPETPPFFFTLPNSFPPACRHHLSKVHSNTCVQRDTQMPVSVVAVGKLENYSIILVQLRDRSEMLQRSTLWNMLVQ